MYSSCKYDYVVEYVCIFQFQYLCQLKIEIEKKGLNYQNYQKKYEKNIEKKYRKNRKTKSKKIPLQVLQQHTKIQVNGMPFFKYLNLKNRTISLVTGFQPKIEGLRVEIWLK